MTSKNHLNLKRDLWVRIIAKMRTRKEGGYRVRSGKSNQPGFWVFVNWI